MARADHELITDWILPAEARRLLIERWGDARIWQQLVRQALADGMPWRCRVLPGEAEDPDLFRRRPPPEIAWREGWAAAFLSNPRRLGPKHWFELSRAWVLALPGKPSGQVKPATDQPTSPPKKRKRQPALDRINPVRDKIWPKGVPGEKELSTPKAVQQLGKECQDLGIKTSPSSLLRSLGRDKRRE